MFNLDAGEYQLDFLQFMDLPKLGWMNSEYETPNDNIFPLLML